MSIVFCTFVLNVNFEYGIVGLIGGDGLTIGENIKKYRKAKGFTQKELAESVGVAAITIQQYERNVREPKMDTVVRLAQALGISVADLYGSCITDFVERSAQERTTEAQKERQTALHKIDRILGQMNAKGIKVAVERVEELSHVPEYQKRNPIQEQQAVYDALNPHKNPDAAEYWNAVAAQQALQQPSPAPAEGETQTDPDK